MASAHSTLLRLVPSIETTPRPRPRVVAEILSDGTVRGVDSGSRSTGQQDDWATGTVSGDGWMLWWERRSWE